MKKAGPLARCRLFAATNLFTVRSERSEVGLRSAAVHGYGEHHRAKIGPRSRTVGRLARNLAFHAVDVELDAMQEAIVGDLVGGQNFLAGVVLERTLPDRCRAVDD